MKKNAVKIIVILMFLAGLSLLLYPFIANQWNSYRQSRLISHYDEVVAGKEAEGAIDYESEWDGVSPGKVQCSLRLAAEVCSTRL